MALGDKLASLVAKEHGCLDWTNCSATNEMDEAGWDEVAGKFLRENIAIIEEIPL